MAKLSNLVDAFDGDQENLIEYFFAPFENKVIDKYTHNRKPQRNYQAYKEK